MDNTHKRHALTPQGWIPLKSWDVADYTLTVVSNKATAESHTKTPRRKRYEKWCLFHRENRHVFELFRRFATEALESGRKVGARMITERLRWHSAIETNAKDFKINDHHSPYYARLLTGLDPRFEGFFTFKDSKFDSSIEEVVGYHRSLKD
jgi:hypothetical protein